MIQHKARTSDMNGQYVSIFLYRVHDRFSRPFPICRKKIAVLAEHNASERLMRSTFAVYLVYHTTPQHGIASRDCRTTFSWCLFANTGKTGNNNRYRNASSRPSHDYGYAKV